MLRLILALLLVLPAGLLAAQHQGCETTSAANTVVGDSAHQYNAGDSGHADHGAGSDSAHVFASDCNGCDLACKMTCAAIVLPLTVQQHASPPSGTIGPGKVVAGLLNPHAYPLIRPPAPSPA